MIYFYYRFDTTTTATSILWPRFQDHLGEPVPEENFRCKGRSTETDTPTNRLAATPCGLASAHLHPLHIFLQARCPCCHPTNSVKALKATSVFGLECYLYRLCTLLSLRYTHTHTQPFYGPFFRTIRVSRCQKTTSGLYGARED